MAPTQSRNRGRVLALALAGAAALKFSWVPLSFTGFVGQQAQPASGSLGRTHARRWSLIQRFARGGEADLDVEVGERVRAMSPDDEQWYPGLIETINGDGTFTVKWDDPDGGPETNALSSQAIKTFFKNYADGDDVFGMPPDDESFYPGNVVKKNEDGTFTVKWDEPDGGPETHDIPPSSMKRARYKKNYKVGDQIEAKYPEDGGMYGAEVVADNGDGTYDVKWEDPDGGPETSKVFYKDMKMPPIPFDQLEVGQKYTGTVRSVRDFGAFVDIGTEGDGLLHISAISTERVERVTDYVEEGQDVEVWISGLRDDGKFGVTMVEGKTDSAGGGRRNGDLTVFQGCSPSDWYAGKVVKLAPFGAFVEVTVDDETATGLVHVSQIRDGFVDNVADELEEGQEVKVRITNVDVDNSKMGLSMKDVNSGGGDFGGDRTPQDVSAFEGMEGTWLKGQVARVAPFGAFVAVTHPESEATCNGLVHISALGNDFVENIEDVVSEGQEVDVRVVSVDTMNNKLGLSMKTDSEARAPQDVSAFEGMEGTWLKGQVARTASFGAFVTVTHPESQATCDGLVHISALGGDFVENVEDVVSEGQEVDVMIASVDTMNNKLGLSMKTESEEEDE